MNTPTKKYFSLVSDGDFTSVLALHEEESWTTDEILKKVGPQATGWLQLSRLSLEDRIDFTREFWRGRLPYDPKLEKFIEVFFQELDDIGIFVTQKKREKSFKITMVYSVTEDRGFYQGALPATDDQCLELQGQLPEHIFPEDYFGFMKIHNGFCKSTDSTGLLPMNRIRPLYDELQKKLLAMDTVKTSAGRPVDPSALVPFYESFGMPYLQCFWDEWHPQQEMGNVYLSVADSMISDPKEGEVGVENLAFKTFIDWLIFYLEQID